jgi:biopolymer transport protein ExbD
MNKTKKTSVRTPKLDMNPMVDMAFLLVSFFMLATTFKTAEPILIDRPSSHSRLKVPETNVVVISVSDSGKVFFTIDGKFAREKLLTLIGDHHGLTFSEVEKSHFALMSSVGLPLADLPAFLSLSPVERQQVVQPGIPCDSLNNELIEWVLFARMANPSVRLAINADRDVAYVHVEKVIQTLLRNRIYRFNFFTELEKES